MVLLDRGTPGTSREIYSKDADDGTGTRNLFELFSSMARALTNLRCCHNIATRRLVYNGGYTQNNE